MGASRMILGVFFLIIGCLMILNYLFGLDLPIFRTILALGFVCLGLYLLKPSWFLSSSSRFSHSFSNDFGDSVSVFSSSKLKRDSNLNGEQYVVVFGQGDIDLRDIIGELDLSSEKPKKIKLISVFGELNAFLPESYRFQIEAESFLGQINVNEKKLGVVIGRQNFTSPDQEQIMFLLDIKAVFGEVNVINTYKDSKSSEKPDSKAEKQPPNGVI